MSDSMMEQWRAWVDEVKRSEPLVGSVFRDAGVMRITPGEVCVCVAKGSEAQDLLAAYPRMAEEMRMVCGRAVHVFEAAPDLQTAPSLTLIDEAGAFRLKLVPPPAEPRSREPKIHMEGRWDDNGPFGVCGKRPARPDDDGTHYQTMTTTWEEVTCEGCLRSRPKG